MASTEHQFIIRDSRKKGFYKIDNELLTDGYGAIVGPGGIAIYNAITLHVDFTTQEAHPSYNRLAELTGMDRRQAIREVTKLEKLNLIHVKRSGHKSNVMTLLDKSEWQKPDSIKRKVRSDKGRSRKKRAVRVTDSHPNIVTDSHPPVVTDSHPTSDYQSPEQDPLNENHLLNNTQQQDVVVVVDRINRLIRETKKGEPISPAFLKKLCRIHAVSPSDVMTCAQTLAEIPGIRSIPAVMMGKKDGDTYESSCFYDGVVLIGMEENAEPSRQSDKTQPNPASSHRKEHKETDLEQYLQTLDEKTRQTLMQKSIAKLIDFKSRMKPPAYQETLKYGFYQEVQRYREAQSMGDAALVR